MARCDDEPDQHDGAASIGPLALVVLQGQVEGGPEVVIRVIALTDLQPGMRNMRPMVSIVAIAALLSIATASSLIAQTAPKLMCAPTEAEYRGVETIDGRTSSDMFGWPTAGLFMKGHCRPGQARSIRT